MPEQMLQSYPVLSGSGILSQSILDVFVLQEILDFEDAEKLKSHFRTNREIEEFLVKNRLVTKDTINKAYSILLKIPYVGLKSIEIPAEAKKIITKQIAYRYGIIPFDIDGRLIRIAISRPADLLQGYMKSLVKLFEDKNLALELFITGDSDFRETVSQYMNKKNDKVLMKKGRLPVIYIRNLKIPSNLLTKIPKEFVERYRIMIFGESVYGGYMVACQDPDSQVTKKVLSFIEKENKIKLEIFAASKDDFDHILNHYEDYLAGVNVKSETKKKDLPDDKPVIQEEKEPQTKKSSSFSLGNFFGSGTKNDSSELIIDSVTAPEVMKVGEVTLNTDKVVVNQSNISGEKTGSGEGVKNETINKQDSTNEGTNNKTMSVSGQNTEQTETNQEANNKTVPNEESQSKTLTSTDQNKGQAGTVEGTKNTPAGDEGVKSEKTAASGQKEETDESKGKSGSSSDSSRLEQGKDKGDVDHTEENEIIKSANQENPSDENKGKTKVSFGSGSLEDTDLGSLLETDVTSSEMMQAIIKEGYVPKIVAGIINYCLNQKVSDVHIEPQAKSLRIRSRIDGVLTEIAKLELSLHPPIVSRIKILSKLKIDETRIPQDGKFEVSFKDRGVDVRVSSMPTVHGEKIVLRILDKSQKILSLEDLGMRGSAIDKTIASIQKPWGIVLSTGPTGSGKSTTLNAVIARLNKPGINIITLEDPVEYQTAGVNQCQIRPDIGFTFASGLRSILRQDPNIIMVGEIRDGETAGMTTQAALTGHLVLATLHTNDTAGALPRLINMGVEPFLITSSLDLVIAQRLIRLICPKCKEELKVPPSLLTEIQKELALIPASNKRDRERIPAELKFYYGRGCDECKQGYKGRIGLFEVMEMSPEIENLAIGRKSANEIKEQSIKSGMITMKQDGILKALEGSTTLDEVFQATSMGKEAT